MQILVGQGHIDHQFRFKLFDQGHQFRHIVRVHLRGLDGAGKLGGNVVAFFQCPAGQTDFSENLRQLGRICDATTCPDPAGTDDQHF